jgi:hypothetical protein
MRKHLKPEKGLKIDIELGEDDRVQTIYFDGKPGLGVFDWYAKGAGDGVLVYYLTKHGDPKTIYAVMTREMWSLIIGEAEE